MIEIVVLILVILVFSLIYYKETRNNKVDSDDKDKVDDNKDNTYEVREELIINRPYSYFYPDVYYPYYYPNYYYVPYVPISYDYPLYSTSYIIDYDDYNYGYRPRRHYRTGEHNRKRDKTSDPKIKRMIDSKRDSKRDNKRIKTK